MNRIKQKQDYFDMAFEYGGIGLGGLAVYYLLDHNSGSTDIFLKVHNI